MKNLIFFSRLSYVSLWGRSTSILTVAISYGAAKIVGLFADTLGAIQCFPALAPLRTSNPSKYADVGPRGFQLGRSSGFTGVTLENFTECTEGSGCTFRLC